MANDNKTYHEQKKIEYTQKLRDVLSTMPSFCKDYFRAIDQTASAKTKLSYAYDIRLFFNYIVDNNPVFKDKSITEFKIDMLNNIKVQDINAVGVYDTVLCNPPYVKQNSGLSKDMPEHIRVCREEVTLTFAEICRSASKALKHGGRFCFVHRADRLAEIIWELKLNKLEPKRLQMVTGCENSTPYLVMIEAVKGGKSGLTVLPNLTNG
jgi:tRNA1(Val) A37 N6-methylase TrmN6